MNSELKSLCQRIGYTFSDTEKLMQALQHRSVGLPNNERLEFLGDAILGFLMAECLYAQHPNAREGQLSRWRSSLVRRETLADLARDFQLNQHVVLGPGESKSGGQDKDSVLADALEALIASIYFDSDMNTCQRVVLGWFESRLADVAHGQHVVDAKTQLQEWLQARQLNLPIYQVLKVSGEAHAQQFTVSCKVEGLLPATQAEAGTRRAAEQTAARLYLNALKKDTRYA